MISLLAQSLLTLITSKALASENMSSSLYYPSEPDLDLSPHYYSAVYTNPNHAGHQTLEYSSEAIKVQIFGGPGSEMTTYTLDMTTGTISSTRSGPAIPTVVTTIVANYCPVKQPYAEALEVFAQVARDFVSGDGEYNQPVAEVKPFSQYLDSVQHQVNEGCK